MVISSLSFVVISPSLFVVKLLFPGQVYLEISRACGEYDLGGG